MPPQTISFTCVLFEEYGNAIINFSCMLSVGTISFERYVHSALAERVRQGEVSSCMAAVAAGYRKALVDTGWAICQLLSCTRK